MEFPILHPAARLVFAAQLLSTLAMFGVIWLVQIVQYPTLLEVAPSGFVRFETAYAFRMGFIAGPLMLVELLSSCLLLAPSLRPATISGEGASLGVALVGVLWASTAFIQVPLHNQLHGTHSLAAIRKLIRSNWVRTAAWTARGGLVLFWVDRLLHPR